ncbi:MAG TPA: hypothetical protein VMZ53_26355 [Kofleriaceae bacterium]|nr:hypothetical protein [Kofleriaceae bacterium]
MGTLRTSEEGAIAAGEGRKSENLDDNRRVDEAPKIIISAGPIAEGATTHTPAPARAVPAAAQRRTGSLPAAPVKQGGIGLVVLLYLLCAAALGYAIYERYFI